jgi:5'-nucleotidase
MLVACDIDGVVVDLLPEWLRRYNKDYDDRLTEYDITDWNTHQFVKPECGLKMYDYLKQPDLYDSIVLLPGALEGLERIRSLGHEVAFVTSCTYGVVDQKAKRLEDLGVCSSRDGHGLPADLIVANTKRWVGADLLIDDRAQTIVEWIADRAKRAILVEMPYNKSIELTSTDWQRVNRAPAHPDRALAWPAIVAHVERLSA